MGENKLKPEKTEKGNSFTPVFNRGKLAKVRGEAQRKEREILKNTSLGDLIK